MLLQPIGLRSQGGKRHAAGNDAAQHRNSFGNTFPHSVFGDLDANNPKYLFHRAVPRGLGKRCVCYLLLNRFGRTCCKSFDAG